MASCWRARLSRNQHRNIRAIPTPARRRPLHRHDRPVAGIEDSTLRNKAIAAGRITKPATAHQAVASAATDHSSTKSQRSRTDAQAATAIGTACTRADERTAAALGLADSGHQTAISTTARTFASPTIAGRMFSRWCQENDFGYMMEHYDIDGLVQYGSEEIPGATRIVNPAWRELDRQLTRLTDTVKMIAYRAETALVGLLRRHLANEAEARALIRELFVSSADLEPDDIADTLNLRIHRMASPVHDRAIALLLADLTTTNFRHPDTGHRFIDQLV